MQNNTYMYGHSYINLLGFNGNREYKDEQEMFCKALLPSPLETSARKWTECANNWNYGSPIGITQELLDRT